MYARRNPCTLTKTDVWSKHVFKFRISRINVLAVVSTRRVLRMSLTRRTRVYSWFLVSP